MAIEADLGIPDPHPLHRRHFANFAEQRMTVRGDPGGMRRGPDVKPGALSLEWVGRKGCPTSRFALRESGPPNRLAPDIEATQGLQHLALVVTTAPERRQGGPGGGRHRATGERDQSRVRPDLHKRCDAGLPQSL